MSATSSRSGSISRYEPQVPTSRTCSCATRFRATCVINWKYEKNVWVYHVSRPRTSNRRRRSSARRDLNMTCFDLKMTCFCLEMTYFFLKMICFCLKLIMCAHVCLVGAYMCVHGTGACGGGVGANLCWWLGACVWMGGGCAVVLVPLPKSGY